MTPTGLGVLQVEPTDHCNLSCGMCAPHAERWESVHGIPKGYLPLSLYQRIVEGLAEEDCHFDHLILQWLGDPSLHPDLERMVGLAGKFLTKNLGYLRFDTNGILLDPKRMERLVEEKAADLPLLVVFTVDAQSPEVYQKVKGRDMLLRVRRHIRHLLSLRRHSQNLHLQVQFVVQEQNAGELRAFHDYWRDAWACHGRRGGHFELLYKRLSVSGGAKGQAQADLLYERAMESSGIRPVEEEGFAVRTWERRPWQQDDAHRGRSACPGLWLTPVIRHDGSLQMCCADMQGGLRLGSLQEQSFRSLWEGPKALGYRMEQLAGRFSGPCATCGGINWYDLSPEHIRKTRLQAGSSPV